MPVTCGVAVGVPIQQFDAIFVADMRLFTISFNNLYVVVRLWHLISVVTRVENPAQPIHVCRASHPLYRLSKNSKESKRRRSYRPSTMGRNEQQDSSTSEISSQPDLTLRFNRFKKRQFLNLLGLAEVLQNATAKVAAQFSWKEKDNEGLGWLSGKRALITGSNKGVGRATAEEFLKHGVDVILACRNKSLADVAASEMQSLKPYSHAKSLGSVEVEVVDLASLDSVHAAAARLVSVGRPIEYLVCNAGVMAPPERLETQDGFEQQFQVSVYEYSRHVVLTP